MFNQQRDTLATRYKLRLQTLSPIHVGSGEGDLQRRALDFIALDDRLVVLDPDRLASGLSEAQLNRLYAGVPLTEIIEALHPDELVSLAAYTLPSPSESLDRLRPHIKIPGSPPRPYLPGSSIKGALRTALAWAMLRDGQFKVEKDDLGRSRYFADNTIERFLFGRDPNHDLLRALQVGDTIPLPPNTGLTLSQVAVYTIKQDRGLAPKGANFRFHLETINPNAVLETVVRRDNYLLEPKQVAELRWDTGRPYLLNLIHHANEFAAGLINQELGFYRRYGPDALVNFYSQLAEQLAQFKTTSHSCLCQIAWGTGWTAKTIGAALDEAILTHLKRSFRLGRAGPVFPKTRRLIEIDGQPTAAPGWLALTFEPIGEEISLPKVKPAFQKPRRQDTTPTTKGALTDLQVGMILEGRVTNITSFGAFVDIGVGRDGLIHISKLSVGYVRQVEDIIQRGDKVSVEVIRIEASRNRINLRLVKKLE